MLTRDLLAIANLLVTVQVGMCCGCCSANLHYIVNVLRLPQRHSCSWCHC